MSKYDGLSISLFSALANGIKLLAGPITSLFVSKNLNSEQIGFYYTFFSLVAMRNLLNLPKVYLKAVYCPRIQA